MKSKVSPDLVTLLLTRVAISRDLNVFTLKEVADNWEISQSTLARYNSPYRREVTRIAAKRFTEAYKALDKTVCQLCPMELKGHPRCPTCTILIHGEPECSCSCIDGFNSLKLIELITK